MLFVCDTHTKNENANHIHIFIWDFFFLKSFFFFSKMFVPGCGSLSHLKSSIIIILGMVIVYDSSCGTDINV